MATAYRAVLIIRTHENGTNVPRVAAFLQGMLEQQLERTTRVIIETVAVIEIARVEDDAT